MSTKIAIFGPPDDMHRGPDSSRWDQIDQEELATNLNELLSSFQKTIDTVGDRDGEMQVSQVQVSVGVSASGKVGLLGTGVEATGTASLSITFTRKSP